MLTNLISFAKTTKTSIKNNIFPINIDNEGIKICNDKKLLGVILNNRLGFGFWYSCCKYL